MFSLTQPKDSSFELKSPTKMTLSDVISNGIEITVPIFFIFTTRPCFTQGFYEEGNTSSLVS